MTKVTNKNKAISFILITILIDVIGIGIIYPIMPRLISELIGGDISTAASYGGWLGAAYALMQFIAAPILGNLSDAYGRRPILLISLLTLGINCIFMAYAPSIFWLFVGRLIGGVSGSSYGVASTYVADTTEGEERTKYYGLLNAAFGVGFIIGPVLGGLLVKWGTHVPFIAAAILSLVNVIYGYFVLPESLSKENRRKFEWRRANPIGAFAQLRKLPSLIDMFTAYFFIYLAGHCIESVWAYYSKVKFSWSEDMIGYSLGFLGISLALVQGVMIRPIISKLGYKYSIYLGLIIQCITFIGLSLVTQSWMVFVLIIPYAFGAISSPALQTMASNRVTESSQGELQGCMASLISLTAIIGPPMMSQLFAEFSSPNSTIYFPGMPFIFGALLIIIGLFFVRKVFNKEDNPKAKTS